MHIDTYTQTHIKLFTDYKYLLQVHSFYEYLLDSMYMNVCLRVRSDYINFYDQFKPGSLWLYEFQEKKKKKNSPMNLSDTASWKGPPAAVGSPRNKL